MKIFQHRIYFLLLIVQITVALVTNSIHPIIPLSLSLRVSRSRTNRLHVIVKVLAGNHFPRPNKLLNHVCGLWCVDPEQPVESLWIRSLLLWDRAGF